VILGSIQSLGLTFHGLVVAKSGTPSHFYWERIKKVGNYGFKKITIINIQLLYVQ